MLACVRLCMLWKVSQICVFEMKKFGNKIAEASSKMYSYSQWVWVREMTSSAAVKLLSQFACSGDDDHDHGYKLNILHGWILWNTLEKRTILRTHTHTSHSVNMPSSSTMCIWFQFFFLAFLKHDNFICLLFLAASFFMLPSFCVRKWHQSCRCWFFLRLLVCCVFVQTWRIMKNELKGNFRTR